MTCTSAKFGGQSRIGRKDAPPAGADSAYAASVPALPCAGEAEAVEIAVGAMCAPWVVEDLAWVPCVHGPPRASPRVLPLFPRMLLLLVAVIDIEVLMLVCVAIVTGNVSSQTL